jgi:hypothetical protein
MIINKLFAPLGANPTIVVYNASAVKMYNAASNLVCLKTKLFASR